MTMMFQGTDFERLNRVDSRRARTAGSGGIGGRASRPRHRPFIAPEEARPHLSMGALFARQATSWLLSARANKRSSVAPALRRNRNAFNRFIRRSGSPRGSFERFLSSINGGERKCARL